MLRDASGRDALFRSGVLAYRRKPRLYLESCRTDLIVRLAGYDHFNPTTCRETRKPNIFAAERVDYRYNFAQNRLAVLLISMFSAEVVDCMRYTRQTPWKVILGTNFEGPKGRWARITQIKDIDRDAVHGHIFAFCKHELCAYEYEDGPLPDLSIVGRDFLRDFIDYLVANDLIPLIGLQVPSNYGEQSMGDLILNDGTVMLQVADIKNCESFRVTGWRFEVGPNDPRACQANEVHQKMNSGNHKVFNAGKPYPKLENVDDLMVALAKAKVV
ncbi:hypothetical protein CIB48_g7050 [Xylaria polymorpha]|nr:hypothetical protein CIB48_g7050 [Xylaria polymorpha]